MRQPRGAAYAFQGVRHGRHARWVWIAAPDVIDAFAAIRQIYSVNVLSQAAALAAVRARSVRTRGGAIRSERTRDRRLLHGIAVAGFPLKFGESEANLRARAHAERHARS